jgi:hypothetical protein
MRLSQLTLRSIDAWFFFAWLCDPATPQRRSERCVFNEINWRQALASDPLATYSELNPPRRSGSARAMTYEKTRALLPYYGPFRPLGGASLFELQVLPG